MHPVKHIDIQVGRSQDQIIMLIHIVFSKEAIPIKS